MSDYLKRRLEQKLFGPTPKQAKIERKQGLNGWYDMQATQAPAKCENCGKWLSWTISFHPRAHICHILPKEHFKSVETHPFNRWFGDLDCHKQYDKLVMENATLEEAVFYFHDFLAEIIIRFDSFKDQIAPEERLRIPQFLLYENET